MIRRPPAVIEFARSLRWNGRDATRGTQFLRNLAANAIVAVAYFIAGKLGLKLAFANPSATAVWPPTGIALTAFLFLGYRVWPGVFLAAFVTNLTTAGTIATSLGIAMGNTLEGILGAYLVKRFASGLSAFEHTIDVLKFAFCAAMLSTAVSATWGVTSLALARYAKWGDYGNVWLTWWMGDAAGDLVLAPAFILWLIDPRLRYTAKQLVEAGLSLILLLATGEMAFGGLSSLARSHYSLEFLCVPVLIWVSLRFDRRIAATSVVLLSALAIRGTLLGFGPFVGKTPNDALILLQAFMAVCAVMTMTLATAVSERNRAARDRENLIAELQTALGRVRTLKGLIPICASCKKIRDDQGYWNSIEGYIRDHSEADFTHGICPTCSERLYPGLAKRA